MGIMKITFRFEQNLDKNETKRENNHMCFVNIGIIDPKLRFELLVTFGGNFYQFLLFFEHFLLIHS